MNVQPWNGGATWNQGPLVRAGVAGVTPGGCDALLVPGPFTAGLETSPCLRAGPCGR